MNGTPCFSAAERAELLTFVRAVISAGAMGAPAPALPSLPQLERNGRSFVTLYENGKVRGSIGSTVSSETLGENLRRNALNAAFCDPCFAPLGAEELNFVLIELSVITGEHPITAAEEYDPERDGIILIRNGRRVLFLPQVVRRERWSRDEALAALCDKAGLAGDVWRGGDVQLAVFQAEVFGE